MTNSKFRTLFVLCLITLLSLPARAQDDEGESCKKKKDKIEINLDLEDLEAALENIPDLKNLPDLEGLGEALEGISDLSGIADMPLLKDGNLKKLTDEAKKLEELLDLDAWKEEVADLTDFSRKEAKKANHYLERLHDHWRDNDACVITDKNDGNAWFIDLLDDVDGAFDHEEAVALAKWMKKKKKAVDRCFKKIGECGAQVGEAAGKWEEKYGDDWEAWGEDFGKRMEIWGEKFGKGMEHWGEDFGKDMEKFSKGMEKWGKNFGKDWEKWGNNLADDIEIHLNDKLDLNLDSLKKLNDLSAIISRGGENMDEDIREVVESALSGIDWDQFGEDINSIVEGSLNDAKVLHLDNKEMLADIGGIAEEVAKAVEAVGKNLDKHEKSWKKEYASDWKELLEALDKAGIELSGTADDLEDLTENLQSMIVINGAKDKEALRKALRPKALLKKKEAIRERDEELDALKEEIKRLKKEMQRMKKERRKAEEIDV